MIIDYKWNQEEYERNQEIINSITYGPIIASNWENWALKIIKENNLDFVYDKNYQTLQKEIEKLLK